MTINDCNGWPSIQSLDAYQCYRNDWIYEKWKKKIKPQYHYQRWMNIGDTCLQSMPISAMKIGENLLILTKVVDEKYTTNLLNEGNS